MVFTRAGSRLFPSLPASRYFLDVTTFKKSVEVLSQQALFRLGSSVTASDDFLSLPLLPLLSSGTNRLSASNVNSIIPVYMADKSLPSHGFAS